VRFRVAGLVVAAAILGSVALAEATTVAQTLRLTSKSDGPGWSSLAPLRPAAATTEVHKPARVLVTGDSMVWGIFEGLDRLLGARQASVTGDPNPGSGISKPILDWAAHARQSVRSVHPDVTVVFLGSADDRFPLTAPNGETLQYRTPAWTIEYARRVEALMATYLQRGKGRVYWVMLPAHRDAGPGGVFRTVNRAVRIAARRFPRGVRVIDEIAKAVAPDDEFHAQIVHDGRLITVRRDDGYHLAPAGRAIASAILLRAMRQDRLLPEGD
jgi:hypothetical protein